MARGKVKLYQLSCNLGGNLGCNLSVNLECYLGEE